MEVADQQLFLDFDLTIIFNFNCSLETGRNGYSSINMKHISTGTKARGAQTGKTDVHWSSWGLMHHNSPLTFLFNEPVCDVMCLQKPFKENLLIAFSRPRCHSMTQYQHVSQHELHEPPQSQLGSQWWQDHTKLDL